MSEQLFIIPGSGKDEPSLAQLQAKRDRLREQKGVQRGERLFLVPDGDRDALVAEIARLEKLPDAAGGAAGLIHIPAAEHRSAEAPLFHIPPAQLITE